MSVIPLGEKDYSDGRTKQAFKDECDINKILQKAQKAGSLSHLQRHGAVYGDYADVPDLLTAHDRLKQGRKIYEELPSELRREFHDMFEFFEYVNNPANAGDLRRLLPQLAEPGRQNPAVRRSSASEANPAVSSAPSGPAEGSASSSAPAAAESATAEPASSTT